MVRGNLLSEHADVVPESAVWLCTFLRERRLPTGNQYGYDFQICIGLFSDSGFGCLPVCGIPGDHYLATSSGLRIVKIDRNKKARHSRAFLFH